MGEWSLVRRKGHWIGLWSTVTQLQTSTSEHGSMYLKCNHTTTYYFYYIEPCSEVESHYYILLLLHTTTYYIEPCSEVESHYNILLLLYWAMLWSGVTLEQTRTLTTHKGTRHWLQQVGSRISPCLWNWSFFEVYQFMLWIFFLPLLGVARWSMFKFAGQIRQKI